MMAIMMAMMVMTLMMIMMAMVMTMIIINKTIYFVHYLLLSEVIFSSLIRAFSTSLSFSAVSLSILNGVYNKKNPKKSTQ